MNLTQYQQKKYLWWFSFVCGLVVLGWLILRLQPVLTPFITAGILAYILNPIVDKLSSTKYIGRGMASFLVVLFAFVILTILLLIIVPMLINQLQSIVVRLPELFRWIQHIVLPAINKRFHTHFILDSSFILQLLQNNSVEIHDAIGRIIPALIKQSGSIIGIIGGLLLLPLVLYYTLLDWPKWLSHIGKIISPRYREPTFEIMRELDSVLGEFLRGELTVMMLAGLVYGGGLSLVGLENGFAIGMVAGLLVFIPYLGMFTGLFLATMAGILQFHSMSGLISIWAVFVVGQVVEGFFLTPYLVGERIGLSPIMVIFSLMVFGQLMGFIGMLLALPMAAICIVLLPKIIKSFFNYQE